MIWISQVFCHPHNLPFFFSFIAEHTHTHTKVHNFKLSYPGESTGGGGLTTGSRVEAAQSFSPLGYNRCCFPLPASVNYQLCAAGDSLCRDSHQTPHPSTQAEDPEGLATPGKGRGQGYGGEWATLCVLHHCFMWQVWTGIAGTLLFHQKAHCRWNKMVTKPNYP